MIRKIVPVLILLSSTCSAQDSLHAPAIKPNEYIKTKDTTKKRKKFFVSFNIGMAVPFEDYDGSTNYNNFPTNFIATNASGYANLGLHGNINGGYYLIPNIALVGKVGIDMNGVMQDALNQQTGGIPFFQYNGSYKIWQFLGGIKLNFRLYEGSFIWVQGMMGQVIANYPSIVISSFDETVNLASAKGTAYCIAFGFENSYTKNFHVFYGLSYTTSHLTYPYITYTAYQISLTEHTPITMYFGSMQLTAGVNFNL